MSFFTWGIKLGLRKMLGETSKLFLWQGSVLEIWIQVLRFLLWLHSLQRITHSTCDQESNLKPLLCNAVHRSLKHEGSQQGLGHPWPLTDIPACAGIIRGPTLVFEGNGAESTIPQPELVWITKLHAGLASSHSCSSAGFSLPFYCLLFCLLCDPPLRCTAPDVSASSVEGHPEPHLCLLFPIAIQYCRATLQ